MNNAFVTKDLHLGALLYTEGLTLLKVDRNGKLCWFVFENKPRCEEIQNKFYAKQLEVNAMDFVNALRVLKDLVFASH